MKTLTRSLITGVMATVIAFSSALADTRFMSGGNFLPGIQGGFLNTSGYSNEAFRLFNAMTVQPDAPRKTLIDNYIGCLKTAGTWSKIDWLVVLAAHDRQAARLNWVSPASKYVTEVGAMTWTVDRGFNVTTQSNLNYLVASEPANAGSNVYAPLSAHSSVYLNQFVYTSYGAVIATTNGYMGGIGQNSSNHNFVAQMHGPTIVGTIDNTVTNFLGSWVSTRTDANTQVLYHGAAVNVTSSTSAFTTTVNTPYRILWGDNSVYWGTPSPGDRVAEFTTGGGLTPTDVSNNATCRTTFLTAIGAN